MTPLSQNLIDAVRSHLSGARLAKFDRSVQVLQDSLRQGGWVKRGKATASAGFYQGLSTSVHRWEYDYADKAASAMFFCLAYGRPVAPIRLRDAVKSIPDALMGRCGGAMVVLSWAELCLEVYMSIDMLDKARPLPVITEIGLSPRVTITLKEMNLDIDLPSIKLAKIETRYRPAFGPDLKPIVDPVTGQQMMEPYHVVVWTPGIKHGRSRFAGSGCEACSKHIPSGRFVPIEARDLKSGDLVSFWIGCDCAANIFGIKDVGVNKEAA